MKNSTIITIIVIVLLIVAGVIFFEYQNPETVPNDTGSPYPTQSTPTVDTSSPSPIITTTPTPTPYISSLSPLTGKVGTVVTINGLGFDSIINWIAFGTSTGSHHIDGTPANVINNKAASTDGKILTFTVPTSGPSGIICSATNHCVAISAIRILPGVYPVTVQNANGKSNTMQFTVTK